MSLWVMAQLIDRIVIADKFESCVSKTIWRTLKKIFNTNKGMKCNMKQMIALWIKMKKSLGRDEKVKLYANTFRELLWYTRKKVNRLNHTDLRRSMAPIFVWNWWALVWTNRAEICSYGTVHVRPCFFFSLPISPCSPIDDLVYQSACLLLRSICRSSPRGGGGRGMM